jgi:hypothetical protein
MAYVLEESEIFKADTIVHVPNGKIKRRVKLECEFKLIPADEVDDLIYDVGDKGFLEEVLVNVSGFDLGEKLKEKGVTMKEAAIANLPMRRQMVITYLKEVNGADEKNSKRRR